jgi:hypothetical protein
MWPIVKSLIKRVGPKGLTAIHGNLDLKFHPLEAGRSTADCLENKFSPHNLWDKNHEPGVKARVQALLEDV